MRPKAEWAIDSEPIRTRRIIAKYLQIIPCAVRMRNIPLAKEREHVNGVMRPLGAFVLAFLEAQINLFAVHKIVFLYFP